MDTSIQCQYPECQFVAESASEAVAIVMFNSHLISHQQPAQSGPGPAKQKIPPIKRPEIKQDVSDEDWSTFVTEWGNFKRCTDIPAGVMLSFMRAVDSCEEPEELDTAMDDWEETLKELPRGFDECLAYWKVRCATFDATTTVDEQTVAMAEKLSAMKN